MERRSLLAGLMVLAISMFLMAGTAFARTAGTTKANAGTTGAEETCKIVSLPSFVAQGEFGASSSVADVVEVSCNSEFAGEEVKLSDTKRKPLPRKYQLGQPRRYWWWVHGGPLVLRDA